MSKLLDWSHYDAILQRQSFHRARLQNARTERERRHAIHNIEMIERERVAELKFLGAWPEPTLEEILAELD